jgi:predicted phosphate transport protein (TIGR00153 family)
MAVFRFLLAPRDKRFFELYEGSAANMVKAAQVFRELVTNWEDIEAKVNQIDDLEHVGDTFTHDIIAHLHRTFVTPFDREDMALLGHSLDDVTDFIHAASVAMYTYKVNRPGPRAVELAEIIVQAATEVATALSHLRHQASLKQVLENCVEINRLENAADSVFRAAMAELFDEAANIADVIKWREVYEHMESATDRCEDVANVLEGVALKHA